MVLSFEMVFLSLTNFYSVYFFAVRILLALLFFVNFLLFLFLLFMSAHEQEDEENRSK